MRIGVIHMTTEASSADYAVMIESNLERVKGGSTTLVHRYVKHLRRATDSARSYPMMLNQADIVAEAVQLAAEGVDAVLVACSGDPAVQECRAAVSIPVVGPLEASIGLAQSYGWKWGLVTVEDRTWSTHLDMLIHAYRMESRYVGMRKLESPTKRIFSEGFVTPQFVIDDLLARCQELVNDGADSILIGSGGLCTFATYHNVSALPEFDVPIFDTMAVGLKFAELRVELKQKLDVPEVSRAGWNERFPDADVLRVTQLFAG